MFCGMRIELKCGLPAVAWERVDTDEMNGQSELRNPPSELPWHQPALVHEVVEFLTPRPGRLVVDCTVGTGGHSLAILPRVLPEGRLVAVDCDPEALRLAEQRVAEFVPQVTCVHGNYRDLPTILARLGISQVDGILADLGMSSFQVDCAARGFSFLKDGPLDMRMDPTQGATAADLLTRLTLEELAGMLETYGGERFARRIARRIVQARREQPITTTRQLARLVREACPATARRGRLHPATRTFQALRVVVNDELGALRALLHQLPDLLASGGRAVILTFHSLEDRLVKRAFAAGARDGIWSVLTKKPVRPTPTEVSRNPRARSAKLRAVERGSR